MNSVFNFYELLKKRFDSPQSSADVSVEYCVSIYIPNTNRDLLCVLCRQARWNRSATGTMAWCVL